MIAQTPYSSLTETAVNKQKGPLFQVVRIRESYALIILRPFLRRAASTLRPFFVAIRLRNPCTFFRLLTLGRNVGPIGQHLPQLASFPKTKRFFYLTIQARRCQGNLPVDNIVSNFRPDSQSETSFPQITPKTQGCP